MTFVSIASLRKLGSAAINYSMLKKAEVRGISHIGSVERITDQGLHDAFQEFHIDYKGYLATRLAGKVYTLPQIAEFVFETKFKSFPQFKEYLKRALWASGVYMEYLSSVITAGNISKYAGTLLSLRVDLEEVIAQYEVNVINSSARINLLSGRKRHIETLDVYRTARNLFHINEATKLEDLSFHEIRPYAVFAIRQTLEMYGKEALGFYSIVDGHRNYSRKHLYSAWDFIKFELNRTAPRIVIPFDLGSILKVQKWSHRFVHTTISSYDFIIWYALEVLKTLFHPPGNERRIYNGRKLLIIGTCPIEITKYTSLKISFSKYLNKGAKSRNEFRVNWKPMNQMRAYILSR